MSLLQMSLYGITHGMLRKITLSVCVSLVVLLFSFKAGATTYVVCVGVANYASPKVNDLLRCEKDAESIASFYSKGTKETTLIVGKEATKKNILTTLSRVFGKATKKDKIIFFFSGHGYPGGFCPYEMDSYSDGLTYAEIFKIMNSSEARIKIIFADACNSGAIRNENGTTTNQKPQPNSDNILMFLSSRGSEVSIESPLMPNGLFTKYLLRGLKGGSDFNKDRIVTAKELFEFVSNGVKDQSNGRQHPVMWGKFSNDLILVDYRKH